MSSKRSRQQRQKVVEKKRKNGELRKHIASKAVVKPAPVEFITGQHQGSVHE